MVDATGVDEDDVVYVLRYFHGGKFVSSPKFDYVDWKVDRLQVDPDRLCYWDIIRNVSAFREVIEILKKRGSVDLYVACLEEVDTFNGGNAVVRSNVVGSSYDHVVGQDHVDVGSQVEIGGPDAENGPEHVEVGLEGEDVGPKLAENEPHIGDNESSVSENGSQHAENGPVSDNGLDHVDVGPEVDDVEPELGDDSPELADNETTDDNGAEDGVDESEEDVFLFNIDIGSDVDEEVEEIREKGRGKRHKEKAADREGQPIQPDNVDEGTRSNDKDVKLEGYETDYISSSDPGEYEDSEQSDDDVPRVRKSLLPMYDPNCVIPMWELGLRFGDNEQFKEAVRKYAFAKGVQLKIVNNEPNRTRFHCMKGCPWTLFSSTDKKLRCYIVKTYNHVHKCYRTNKNKLISVKYIHKQFKDIILANPKMKVKTLKEMCKKELGVYASFNMCQRARKQVIKEFRESYVEEYASLWRYAAELLKSNPGSTVSIQVHKNDVGQAMFFRIYVCFQDLKQAWAVIEVECASSWRWFLKKLFTDLEHPTGEGIKLMSNQQKGLVKVLVEDYPDTAYRMCARHLSTYIEEFDDNLQKLEKLGPTSTEDLLQNLVQHWAKAYFSATSTCDVVDNNMAEAFNAWILDARCKPIISLLEDIRVMVTSRLHVKRTWASKWRTNISPKALEKLEHNMEQSTHCRLVWNGDGGFEVQHGEDQHIVDVKQLKCTCRAWELSGIPCCHAICAMYQENKRPEDYVSNWYSKEKYLAAYNHGTTQNFASSTTGPPGMVHGSTQNVASTTTQNVASATTGPPGMVHGTTHNIASATTQNIASATTGPPGIVQSTTQNVASTISQSSNQNVASASTVAPTTQPKPIKKTYKKKAQVGIGLYTDMKTGDQIWNPGTSTERVVTRASKRTIGETDPSQFQHHSKGKGLRWKGNTAMTTRKLQENVETVRKKRGRPSKSQTLGTQSSQT
ncbi:hypothetical protein V6N13_088864 [Hibiscus sabdariffa]